MTLLLLHPAAHAVLLIVLSALLRMLRRPRAAGGLMFLAAAWLVLWSLPVATQPLVAGLEGDYPPVPRLADVPTAQAIVVLGGGIAPGGPGYPDPNLREGADRVWYGARLFRAGRAPFVLLSGGSVEDTGLRGSEAEAMERFLLDLGVPAGAIVLEPNSRTTRENATESAPMLAARGARRILLVTSAMHMARAKALFESQGLEVIPAATDHQGVDLSRQPAARRWLPDGERLDLAARCFKETIGRWRDRHWPLPPAGTPGAAPRVRPAADGRPNPP